MSVNISQWRPLRILRNRRSDALEIALTKNGFAVGFGLPTAEATSIFQRLAGPVLKCFFRGYVIVSKDDSIIVVTSEAADISHRRLYVADLVRTELDANRMNVDVVAYDGNLVPQTSYRCAEPDDVAPCGSAHIFDRYRRSAVAARAMLIAAAATEWRVPICDISAAGGILSEQSGKRASYGRFASTAAMHLFVGERSNVPFRDLNAIAKSSY